jgi:curved DNA-binding protein CbpA
LGSDSTRKTCPALAKGVDLTRMDLTYDEGLLAARIDGRTPANELALLLGWPPDRVAAVFDDLRAKGVVEVADAPRSDPYGAFIFPLPLMQADCALDEEQRKKVIYTYEKLDALNHYELLGVRRRDDAKAIKAAFQSKVFEWHPDKWPKNSGPFAKMIQQIFERVKRASAVLSNEKSRVAYDAELGPFYMDEDDLAEMKAQQRRKEREAFRERERVDRRKRRNPMIKRLDQAREHYRKAIAHEKAGEVVEGLREAQTAVTFDPKNEDFAKLVERLSAAASDHRIGPAMAKGRRLEHLLRFDEAIECFEHAVRHAPENGEVRLRLAYNLVQAQRETQEALKHAKKAVELLPEEAEAHYVLALCWMRADAKKAAVSAAQRALDLRPSYAEAKKLLKKLRWW